MAKTTSIIELNGQRFDAHSGVPLDDIRLAQTKRTVMQDIKQPTVARAVSSSKQVHKTAEPSHTLMRKAVKKPSTITLRKTIAMDVVSPSSGQTTNQVFHTPDPSRFKRATNIHKLSLISRFGAVSTGSKAAQPPHISETKPTTINTPLDIQPVSSSQKSAFQPRQLSRTSDLLDKGLRAATSHIKPITKKSRLHHRLGKKIGLTRRGASITTALVAILALGGFLVHQNIPNLAVRYASAKSGVRAALPSYQPAGFAVANKVDYSPGELSISYHANADTRAYTIIQKNTSWNSEALKDHLKATSGINPESYPNNGQTIYLHDGSQADWVSNGVWYSITGKSSLTTDQLIKIATSM